MLSDLEALFSSAARVHVLHLFLSNLDRQFYQREIERETGQPIRAVQREAERLQDIGLLRRAEEGNRVFYRLDPDFALKDELIALFEKATGAGETDEAAGRFLPPEPATIRQPFPWIETLPVPPLPDRLRAMQIQGEWDQAY
jgi:hypothetical protein